MLLKMEAELTHLGRRATRFHPASRSEQAFETPSYGVSTAGRSPRKDHLCNGERRYEATHHEP